MNYFFKLFMRHNTSINFDKISAYKETISLNEDALEDVIQPLTRAIKKLGAARKEWLGHCNAYHQ